MKIESKYDEIIGKVISDEFYGKKNPVDIAMYYGYSKQDAEDLMAYLKNIKSFYEPDIAYFEASGSIYSVDVNTLKCEKLHASYCIDDFAIKSIKYNLYCWYKPHSKVLNWKILDSEKNILFCEFDNEIENCFITKNYIVVCTKNHMEKYEIHILNYSGKYEFKMNYDEYDQVLEVEENDNGVYVFISKTQRNNTGIIKIEKSLKKYNVLLSASGKEARHIPFFIVNKDVVLYYYEEKIYDADSGKECGGNADIIEKLKLIDNNIKKRFSSTCVLYDDIIFTPAGVPLYGNINIYSRYYLYSDEYRTNFSDIYGRNINYNTLKQIVLIPSGNMILGVKNMNPGKIGESNECILKFDLTDNTIRMLDM